MESDDQWLIDIEFGWTRKILLNPESPADQIEEVQAWNHFSDRFPSLAGHLIGYADEARKRLDKGQYWWELRACTYGEKFAGRKLLCPDFSQGPKFSIENKGLIPDCTVFFLPEFDDYLLAILNSKVSWFFLFAVSNPLRGGKWRLRMKSQYVSQVPIPDVPSGARARLAASGQTCTDAARQRFDIQSAVRRRILDLAPPERAKLTGKLHNWHELDFAAFLVEVKRAFHRDVRLMERGEWETYLSDNTARVRELSDRIATAEREIDAIVYALFDLTPDEIALLEASLTGQYLVNGKRPPVEFVNAVGPGSRHARDISFYYPCVIADRRIVRRDFCFRFSRSML